MPELPEMETYKRLLTPQIVMKQVTGTDVTREKSINVAPGFFNDSLVGTRVIEIERRAKHLLFRLDNGYVLLLHLMLGGMMAWGTEEQKPDRTIQVTIAFGRERLYFIGLRLGYLHLLTGGEAESALSKLGPEPLAPELSEQTFRYMLASKRGVLKNLLVDQHVLSGIGNCYSDEIAFTAGLMPSRRVEKLDSQETGRLYRAMLSVLQEAIGYGGYMEMPLYEGDRLTGGFDKRCRVYDREGEPCVRCGTPIVRADIGSRKSFCCKVCQK